MSYVFKSGLAESILAFLSHKRGLGYKYKSGEYTLSELDRYYVENGDTSRLSQELVEGWIFAKEASATSPYRQYLSTVREFGRFLRMGRDPDAYLVSDSFKSRKYRPIPYFLSEEEIHKFFGACDKAICRNRGKTCRAALPTLFILMHCCGLRTVEARTLLTSDVHLGDGYIDIILAKHHKDRRIFLGGDLREHLTRYDEKMSIIYPVRSYFFPSSEDKCFSANSVGQNFNKIWDAAGLRNSSGKQPRPYDFRHHFAYANVNRWAAAGKNVNAMLPYLMRYMGHSSLESTSYYVHLVPDFFAAYAKMTGSLEDMIPEVGYEDRR